MDKIIGMIVFVVHGTQVPSGYLPADGRCLPIAEYRELSEAFHDDDKWPYGQCGSDGFRIPDLTPKRKGGNDPIRLVRVE